MRASADSLTHNFKKRFRSSARPCASGVSVALRTRRLMQASDSGVCDDRRRAISIGRSRALPLAVSCTRRPCRDLNYEFRPLQNHGCFLKIKPRIAWVELARVSIAQVTEKIDLPLAVGKECRIQFVSVETRHRPAI